MDKEPVGSYSPSLLFTESKQRIPILNGAVTFVLERVKGLRWKDDQVLGDYLEKMKDSGGISASIRVEDVIKSSLAANAEEVDRLSIQNSRAAQLLHWKVGTQKGLNELLAGRLKLMEQSYVWSVIDSALLMG